ncbi:MAG: hypothetical protein KF847_00615 [Pirellulales bacterium]|nr:hypothetical protein [Pirellulales bacterium]
MGRLRIRRARWTQRERPRIGSLPLVAAIVAITASGVCAFAAELADGELAALVARLNASDAAERDAAEQTVVAAGVAAADMPAFLARLPEPVDAMPAEVKLRLERIRTTIERSTAEAAVAASRLTLELRDAPLDETLAAIAKATGNQLVDYRNQFGQDSAPVRVTLSLQDVEFWPAVDQMLDDANLSPYAYSGDQGLGLVERGERELRRSGRAAYAGPFRLEATSVHAQRGLRVPEESNLLVVLETAWEPRLAPIALSLDAAGVKAVADDGRTIPLQTKQRVIDVELTAGNYASEITLPLVLPAREATMLATITGRLTALTPGKIAAFTFADLATAERVEQKSAGVAVSLDRVRKNGELWEVHMRLRIEGRETGLESHRGWVFDNVTYLENEAGEQIEHVGFETVVQTQDEIGFAYLFEIEGDLAQYKWIYKTPAAIVSVPIEFELHDIPLP